jgi:subtilisin family serine protease
MRTPEPESRNLLCKTTLPTISTLRVAPRHLLAFALKTACFALVAFVMYGEHATAQAAEQPERQIRYAKARILVHPRAGLTEKELDRLLTPHGGKRVGYLKQIDLHVVDLPEQANVLAVAEALSKNPHIEFAEPDILDEPVLVTNDPYYPQAWHLQKIGAPFAWDYSTAAGVTIAVLDSGIDLTHPDLVAQLVPGWNFYDNNNNTSDVYGHGTQVAGVAAAAGDNAIGVASIAWRAKIMPIRVTDTSGGGYWSLMAQGITWAADRGARVANLSFQSVATSLSIHNAAQYMRSKGGVVVVAAGNSGLMEPYNVSAALTAVSATDANDNKASWSSYGTYVDAAAPGVSLWTTRRGGGYTSASGTSVASPATAAVYALMIGANPNLAPTTLDGILFSTAKDLGSIGVDPLFGAGRIDALGAVAKAKASSASDSQPPTVAISSPTGGQLRGVIPVDVSATDNVGVTKVELLVDEIVVATDTITPFGFSWDTTTTQDGVVTIQARAYDSAGNQATSAPIALTVANDAEPPSVSITAPSNGAVVSSPTTISVTAADNQRVSKISLTIDGKEVALAYGSSLTYSWNPTATKGKRKQQSSSITAKAWDPAGNMGTTSISVSRL